MGLIRELAYSLLLVSFLVAAGPSATAKPQKIKVVTDKNRTVLLTVHKAGLIYRERCRKSKVVGRYAPNNKVAREEICRNRFKESSRVPIINNQSYGFQVTLPRLRRGDALRLATTSYFLADNPCARKYPDYTDPNKERVKLVFQSHHARRRTFNLRIVQPMVNSGCTGSYVFAIRHRGREIARAKFELYKP
jgi:hypothetical protein